MGESEKTHSVKILPSGEVWEWGESRTLLELFQKIGQYTDASCGGEGRCGRCRVQLLSGELSRGGEGDILACRSLARSDLVLDNPLAELQAPRVSSRGAEYRGGAVGLAVDLGTTMVKARLVDAASGEILLDGGMINPQGLYGSDVLARLGAARTALGRESLKTLLLNGLKDLTELVCREGGVPVSNIHHAVLVGNTAMMLLLIGGDVDGLALAPYASPFEGAGLLSLPASDSFPVKDACFLPVLGGFVGSDITAGILSTGLDRESGTRLFIDVGTNGEIVLAHQGKIFAASAPAGPALEGGHLTCGMPAIPGAVEGVRLGPSGQFELTTIGEGPPRGFCGSGVIELLSVMLEIGVMDASGALNPSRLGVENREQGLGFSPLPEEPCIFITQEDIRAVQLAVGALRAGAEVLLTHQGIPVADLDGVVLTGAFGAHLDPEAAVRLGLVPGGGIPLALQDSAALRGAVECLVDSRRMDQALALAASAEHVHLAEQGFEEVYLRCLTFPET